MSKSFCVLCNKEVNDQNWRHKNWGSISGWGCSKHFTPVAYEAVPERIKEERKVFAKDLIQPFRQGEFSAEFKEHYPEQAKGMLKDGAITQKEYDRPKNTHQLGKGI